MTKHIITLLCLTVCCFGSFYAQARTATIKMSEAGTLADELGDQKNSGRTMAAGTMSSGTVRITLPSGVYMAKAGETVKKTAL